MDRNKISKKKVLEINKKLGKEFKTDFSILNESNLDYALSLKSPCDIAKEILKDYYDVLLSLSKWKNIKKVNSKTLLNI